MQSAGGRIKINAQRDINGRESYQYSADSRVFKTMLFCPPEAQAVAWNRVQAREATSEWERLFGPLPRVQLQPGVQLFGQGKTPEYVFFLVEGLVLLYCDLPDGTEAVLGVRFPGQIIEQCAYDLSLPYPVSARTLLPSVVYQAPPSVVRSAKERDAEKARFFERQLRIDLYNAAVFIMDLKTSGPSERLEKFLRLLGEFFGRPEKPGEIIIPLPVRDEQLADLLGYSSRHLKRVKRQMQQAGRFRLRNRRNVVIHAVNSEIK